MRRLFALVLLAGCTGTFNLPGEGASAVTRAAVVACSGVDGDVVRAMAWSSANQDGCGETIEEGRLLEDCGWHAAQIEATGCDTLGVAGARAQVATVATGPGAPQGTVALTGMYLRECASDTLLFETSTATMGNPPSTVGEVTFDDDVARFSIDVQDISVSAKGVFCDLRGPAE